MHDAETWIADELKTRPWRAAQAKRGAGGNLTIPVAPMTLGYALPEGTVVDASKYTSCVEVPEGATITIYMRKKPAVFGDALLVVCDRSGGAIATLKKGCGFRGPVERRFVQSRSARLVGRA